MFNRENRDSNLAARILLTLHLAERRGYALNILHHSNTLIGGEIQKETVFRELQTMPEVVHQEGMYCLKGSECLLPETKRRLLCNGAAGPRYETEAYALFGDRI
ncbi:MAG: hypothetical protein O8C66_06045 [Candidatus Methanoperedens sp.]|nr:hypothetical protein [Candidatus Methanoperedens sp.]MCZ7370052.1 hypothetical protein [Candidatus Methanoperedens sp.]